MEAAAHRSRVRQETIAGVLCVLGLACGSNENDGSAGASATSAGAGGSGAGSSGSSGGGATGGSSGAESTAADAGGSGGAGGGAGSSGAASGGTNGGSGASDAGDDSLAAAYPGDVGLGSDPAVVWFEDFEAGSLAAIAARYDQTHDAGRWTLVTDTPNGSGNALALRAGQGESAVDLYKQLPDADEWYVRWYAHYEANVPWHHSGMWFGGYNPSMPWPSPMAGVRPSGDDRFSISVEPVYGVDGGSPRFDFYNYWMGMHSWMAEPIDDNGMAYWGNGLVHRNDFTVDPGTWVCLEVHVKLNPDPANAAGAMLEVWKNDALVQSFSEDGPLGWWIRDKFCPASADGSECTDYPAPADSVLDLQHRTTADLRLNAFWPQNYITDDAMGTLVFDQMVVATRRVGCTR